MNSAVRILVPALAGTLTLLAPLHPAQAAPHPTGHLCTSSNPGALILELSGSGDGLSCTRYATAGPLSDKGTAQASIVVYAPSDD